MKQKIQHLLASMNTGLIDREHAIKAALLTVLAGENLVLIGPPGTAKSMVSRRVAQHIQTSNSNPNSDGADSYFEYLLTKFSTPEEIFGPLSISELKADRFRRNTAGYLPTAQIAFLDEIFKSSSSILNALLTILNERIFHNGNQPQHVPLRSLISASNELPTGQEELSALYDRFLMRTFVGPVREDMLHRLFDSPGSAHKPTQQLTTRDFQAVDAAAQQIQIPPEVGEAIRGIWAAHKEAFKEDRREYLSDRRLVKLLKLLRVSAATNHRTEVDFSDAMLLQHCLWNHPDNMTKVRELVISTLLKHSPVVPADSGGATLEDAVYEVSSDGRQLVQQPRQRLSTGRELAFQPDRLPVAPSQNGMSQTLTQQWSATKTRTKGFMGSGTAQDPIRIGSAEDLISMDDPDIALKGLYFVQTHDIDCGEITTWPSFEFQGHYDGNKKKVLNLKTKNNNNGLAIFSTIRKNSSVIHLLLDGNMLTNNANGVIIKNCHVSNASLVNNLTGAAQLIDCEVNNGNLIAQISSDAVIAHCQVKGGELVGKNAANTEITDCQVTGGGLVGDSVINSKIIRCQVIDGLNLIWGNAKKSLISDCVVAANWRSSSVKSSNKHQGLIAAEVSDESLVERCFVDGSFIHDGGDIYYGSIAGYCLNGTIQQCAMGRCSVKLHFPEPRKRIVYTSVSSRLENNASIDTNPGNDEVNGPDGKTVAAARFNQRFFEGNLGWDFDTVWEWDEANNRPTLRFDSNTHTKSASAVSEAAVQPLLTRQVEANIWL